MIDPLKCLSTTWLAAEEEKDPVVKTALSSASKLIAEYLDQYPFVFTIDEAEKLAALPRTRTDFTYFEVLRRAISYIPAAAKIIFTALGTSSDIKDINPHIIENSCRRPNVNQILDPIIIRSNFDIFRKELPFTKLNVNYQSLQNPLMFFYLLSLGHPIWSSLAPSHAVQTASTKLLNGSGDVHHYILVIWMLRCNLYASPKREIVRKLIASHMLTIFGMSKNIDSITAEYPSDPIQAMGARSLIKEKVYNEDTTRELLFTALIEKLDAVSVDRGYFGEVIASFALCRFVDLADSCAFNGPPPVKN